MFQEFFKADGAKRLVGMVLGNIFLGMGVSIFKLAHLGNDAYNGMLMSLADCTGIPYARFFVLVSGCLFFVELMAGRHFIGIGTIVNTFFLGYIVTFFYNVWVYFSLQPGTFFSQTAVMLIGLVVCSFGISLYQTSDVGISPYDSMALILDERLKKVPYFWCRIFMDGLCALICFLTGGLVGLGTLVVTFGFGPCIHFFNGLLDKKNTFHIQNDVL